MKYKLILLLIFSLCLAIPILADVCCCETSTCQNCLIVASPGVCGGIEGYVCSMSYCGATNISTSSTTVTTTVSSNCCICASPGMITGDCMPKSSCTSPMACLQDCPCGTTSSSTTISTTTVKEEPKVGCFGTAVYGSPSNAKLASFREFRDRILMKNQIGEEFVRLYYEYSPNMIELLGGNEFTRIVVRELVLNPIHHILKFVLLLY